MPKPAPAASNPHLAWLLLLAAAPAFAGRPFTTEDASVLAEKACQVEAWVDRSKGATTAWLVPACNFGANIEWQVGGARSREDGRFALAETYVQAKTVFAGSQGSPWHVGLVLGVVRRPQEAEFGGWENPYAIVPFSYALGQTNIHASVGGLRDRARDRNLTLWGIAAEHAINERFTFLGEAYGENSERPALRIGARYTAIKDHLDVDLSVVTRPGGTREERFFSLGVTWQSGRFLP